MEQGSFIELLHTLYICVILDITYKRVWLWGLRSDYFVIFVSFMYPWDCLVMVDVTQWIVAYYVHCFGQHLWKNVLVEDFEVIILWFLWVLCTLEAYFSMANVTQWIVACTMHKSNIWTMLVKWMLRTKCKSLYFELIYDVYLCFHMESYIRYVNVSYRNFLSNLV
jgi:hypothetical protein